MEELWAQHNRLTNAIIVRLGVGPRTYKFYFENDKGLTITIDGNLMDPWEWYLIKEVIFKVTKKDDGYSSGLARKLLKLDRKVCLSGIHIVLHKSGQ